MPSHCFRFLGSSTGEWRIQTIRSIVGPGLAEAPRLSIANTFSPVTTSTAAWQLRGVTSNQRYTNNAELSALVAVQPPLGRPTATCAALIPLTKSDAWWALAQDDRREIFEARSAHIATGLRYLPAIARRLHHSRDLGEDFDFITWFEFAPADESAFDDLLAALRETEEWRYVVREVEVRVVRDSVVSSKYA
jgi:chlorite dismutase